MLRPSAAVLPDRIGPYEIIEELGRGGMGYIYAAQQQGLGRIVALKVLPSNGNDLAGLDLRFLREAQTVARLKHPNVVAVYDSGRADGYTYFSMEYIAGGDLGRRLRERPFTPDEAAVLMEKVASGVAAAHAEGVLHRDIKPTNILLDENEPKLADFGLAAQLEAGGDLTAISGVLGTPHYLAPEALRGGSAALTVASDLYALGAVLYEMLTGRTPFAGVSPAELATQLATAEPPTPRLLAPTVARDLETICLKCLERDPARRYASAAALATDLHRYLAREPILARPPSAWDRCRKFAARHRVGVTAGGVAVAMLIAATAVSAALALRARRAERDAAAQAHTATALSDFLLNDLLAQADPDQQPDRNVTLHTVLDRAAKKIDGRFPDQPKVEADLHGVVGEVYDSLGDYTAAQAHMERRLVTLRTLKGHEDPETLTAMYELAAALFDAGKLDEAFALASRTLVARRRVLGPEHRQTLETANMVAMLLRDRGQIAPADALFAETLAIGRRVLPKTDSCLITSIRSLGSLRLNQFRVAEAEVLLREAVELQTAASGPESIATTTALNDLATALRQEGKLDEARPIYERLLEVRRRILGPEHPFTLISMGNLAGLYKAQKKLAEAEKLQAEALAIGTRTLGPDHPRVLIWSSNLADTYREEDRLDRAIPLIADTVERAKRVHGIAHATTLGAELSLAEMLALHGEPGKAEPLLREVLANATTAGAPPWKIDGIRSELGEALAKQGRNAEAEPLLRESYDRLRAAEPKIPPVYRKGIGSAGDRLASFYAATGRTAEADAVKKELGK